MNKIINLRCSNCKLIICAKNKPVVYKGVQKRKNALVQKSKISVLDAVYLCENIKCPFWIVIKVCGLSSNLYTLPFAAEGGSKPVVCNFIFQDFQACSLSQHCCKKEA